MRVIKVTVLTAVSPLALSLAFSERTASAQQARCAGECPALEEHVSQSDIEAGAIKFKKLLELGLQELL
jgi:hypothetical protein